jgi:hypothetical protein
MFRDEVKALKSATPRDLRKFGLVVGGVFVLLGLFFWWRHKPWYWWLLVPGVPLAVLGAIFPRSLKWIYVGWMTFAMVLGAIVSTVLLVLLFYLVVTPVGFVARLAGKDFLNRRLEPNKSSYWSPRNTSRAKQRHEHERQF